jgi:hypothetical protein
VGRPDQHGLLLESVDLIRGIGNIGGNINGHINGHIDGKLSVPLCTPK